MPAQGSSVLHDIAALEFPDDGSPSAGTEDVLHALAGADTEQHGRIEAYIHTDAVAENRGGCLVRVTCDTERSSRHPAFVAFARQAARLAYAAGASRWEDVAERFPDVEHERIEVQAMLSGAVAVSEIRILRL